MATLAIGWRRGAIFLLAVAAGVWLVWDFIPIRLEFGSTPEMRQAGRELFVRQWVAHDPRAHGDGLGPVFNANSCVACHFQGGVGGGGDRAHNVTAFEVHPNVRDGKAQGGLVHAFAVKGSFAESQALLKKCFPIIAGGDRVVGGCTVRIEDFDPLRVETINSTALYGDGLIDRIPVTAISLNHTRRMLRQVGQEIGGNFNTIGLGRPRVLANGRIGKFGWKAQFATLKEFVAAACANELGLGNPLMEQAKPLASDYRCEEADLTRQEFRQLVAFVDALPRPIEVVPQNAAQREQAARGKALFSSVGCAVCHVPDLGGVAGFYSDLMLHSLTAPENDGYRHEILVEVPLPAGHPKPDEWRTPPLWGVADSAPYFHDGGSPTLRDAILRHEGDASVVTKAFKNLPQDDQQAIIAFLKTLQAPAEAEATRPLVPRQLIATNR